MTTVLTATVFGATALFFSAAATLPSGDDEYRPVVFFGTPVAIVLGVVVSAAMACIFVAPKILGYRSLAGVISTVVAGIITAQALLLVSLLAPKMLPPQTDQVSLAIFGAMTFILGAIAIYIEDSHRTSRHGGKPP